MKIKTGIVTGSEDRKNRDATRVSRVLQVQITSPEDVQSVEQIGPGGQDFNPPDGSRVVILEIGAAYKVAIAVDDLQEPVSAKGERRIYSVDGETVKALIYLRADGSIEVNGSADNAVRFQALQDKLTLLEAQLKAHVHPGVITGPSSTGASVTPFDADISAAKVDSVKLP